MLPQSDRTLAEVRGGRSIVDHRGVLSAGPPGRWREGIHTPVVLAEGSGYRRYFTDRSGSQWCIGEYWLPDPAPSASPHMAARVT